MKRGRKAGVTKPGSLHARLSARCTEDERVKIQQAATRGEKTESEFIREAAVERAEEETKLWEKLKDVVRSNSVKREQ